MVQAITASTYVPHEADRKFRFALQLADPENALSVVIDISVALHKQKRIREAIKLLENCNIIALDSSQEALKTFTLAALYTETNQVEKAIKSYRKTMQYIQSPSHKAALWHDLAITLENARKAGALELAREALGFEKIPKQNQAELYLLLGKLYRNRKKPADAMQAYEMALECVPAHSPTKAKIIDAITTKDVT